MEIDSTDSVLWIDDVEVNLPADINSIIELDSAIVVQLDTLNKADHLNSEGYSRNVWCIESDGTVRWKIKAAGPMNGQAQPYTSIWEKNGSIFAYNWNGLAYKISMQDGTHCDSRVIK